jgi:FRG domain
VEWLTQRVKNFSELRELIDGLTETGKAARGTFLFRGQPDSTWSLEPSFTRIIKQGSSLKDALQYEQVAVAKFMAQAHLYVRLPLLRLSDVEIWGLMQHYGAPTRLLDWSASPYVGAYFAVNERWGMSDGALWAFRADLIANFAVKEFGEHWELKLMKDEFWRDPAPPPCLYAFRRGLDSDRMAAQQGCFTACRHLVSDHAQVIGDLLGNSKSKHIEKTHLKIVIPAKLKPNFLHCLRMMNIAGHSLFPGIDGVGGSVADTLRLQELTPALALHKFVRRLPLH